MEDGSNHSLNMVITSWVQGLGVNYNAILNAAQLLACCGGSLSLPSTARFTRFSKSHVQPSKSTELSLTPAPFPGSAAACAVARSKRMRGNSDLFFLKTIPEACRTIPLRAIAYQLIFKYVGLHQRDCPPQSDVAVAHIRTLDMDPNCKTGCIGRTVHPGYGQPPLGYYLSAWNHSGKSELHVVHKDTENPVVQALRLLIRTTGLRIVMHSDNRFEKDMRVLLCATTVIMSRSALRFPTFASPRLEQLYEYEPPHRLYNRYLSFDGCATRRFYTRGGVILARWTATPAQKLHLLLSDVQPSDFEEEGRSPEWSWCMCNATPVHGCRISPSRALSGSRRAISAKRP